MLKTLFTSFLVLCSLLPSAQVDFPKNDFIAPVDFKLALSGTFGELRPNHFHSGIDIKTFGAINKPLYAIADGFVSRVAVSPGGFGKAVYIEHPNGYTSVYAHCNKFADEIAAWVKKEQYRLESFQVNLYPEHGQFKVKKGEIIAYSGNSGGSMGPHLHFEIRKTNGQIPVNPLHFGFAVKDFIRPNITRLSIFPTTPYSVVNGKNKVFEPELAGWGPNYRIKDNDSIQLSGEFYFGINTYDRLNDSRNHNGVYEVSLFIDSNLVYSHKMDEFSFSESRYVNSLIDYSTYINKKRRYQKTYIEPNNNLSLYTTVEDDGVFLFIDKKYHEIKYVVKDFNGNESVLSFTAKSSPPEFNEVFSASAKNSESDFFSWDQNNYYSTNDFSISIPAGAIYDTLAFCYDEISIPGRYFSSLHSVHRKSKAIHKSCKISIRPNGIPPDLKDKAVIVNIEDDESSFTGGDWEDEFLTASIRTFGNYTIDIDTISPKITPLNIKDGKEVTSQSKIKISIDDDLSGIDTIKATLNGEWLLMEWDPKSNLLVYNFDGRLRTGQNEFRLEVTDMVKNKSTFTATFTK